MAGKIPNLYVIAGPTASGKTGLSIALAERLGGRILSCDSLCVYCGMDIGTAKPDAEEQARVPHYGIDLVPARERFSVGRYQEYARGVVEELSSGGIPIVVVGGSGFYLKSFFTPVTDELEIPPSVDREIAAYRDAGGDAELRDWLLQISPEAGRYVDLANPRRVENALRRSLASGRTLEELQRAFAELPAPFAAFKKFTILLERAEEAMIERNRLRVSRMLDAGLIDEVRRLRAAGFEENPSASGAIGYRETLEYLDGKIDTSELGEEIITHTNQLRRKQRTWFRKQIPVDLTLDPIMPGAADRIMEEGLRCSEE